MSNDVLPMSLRELVNQLNAPPAAGQSMVDGIVIEQDWVDALRRSKSGDGSPRVMVMVALINEIERLQKKLAASELRRNELEQLIDTDPMVPVLNRRAFERDLDRAIAWAKRSGKPGSLLYLDLNGLKGINDTYGHVVGDRAIERLAKMLILSCRSTDLIGRLGGDEFAVIMPETPPSGALIRAERVGDLLARVPLVLGNITLFLSSACGAASFSGNESHKDVMEMADAAMYAHKQRMKELMS